MTISLIQMACDTEFVFNIDGHTMDVIEVEGTAVHPYTIDQLTIHQGQRYSVVLHANQKIGNYWMHALPYPGRADQYTFEGGANSALLRYRGAKEIEPPATTQPNATKPFHEYNLVPAQVIPAPGKPFIGGADVTLNFVLKVNEDFNFTLNGVAFHSPPIPVLLQILSGAKTAKDLLPSGSVYPLPKNKVIEVSIPAIEQGAPHPFHLHGVSF